MQHTEHSLSSIESGQLPKVGKLQYVHDEQPGWKRKRLRKTFQYLDLDGKPLRDAAHIARIKSLAIPPAWTDVWICAQANGHIQATGRDAKGRKQYRYHTRWRELRDDMKYENMISFGMHLPMIRKKVARDLTEAGLTRDKVIATIIFLLEKTMIRIGNDEYAHHNKSYGLTTLRNRHLDIQGADLLFHFVGKSKVEHRISLHDPKLARIVKQIKELPGQELFQYMDGDGQRHKINSADVNEYLQEITGEQYTAKDFRTWAGTLQTTIALAQFQQFENMTQAKSNVVLAINAAAKKLGNTPTICKKCYVHPGIIQSYMSGELFPLIVNKQLESANKNELSEMEQCVITLLRDAAK
ncbi:MAG TPA: DNA topoisomerase IB [Methylophilaceae bacterium]|jgi:DNA topoisomerase-1